MLRSWVERPLLSPVAIRRRLAAVEELFRDNVGRAELTEKLKTVGDIQRLTSRAVYGAANGRDMLALGNYLSAAPEIFAQLGKYQSGMLRSIAATEPLENLCALFAPRHLRRAAVLRARGRHPPLRLQRGGRPSAQHPRQRREMRRRAGGAGKGAHRHQEAQGRLQQSVRVLYRRAELRRSRGLAGGIHTQADARQRRAVLYPGAQKAGG